MTRDLYGSSGVGPGTLVPMRRRAHRRARVMELLFVVMLGGLVHPARVAKRVQKSIES